MSTVPADVLSYVSRLGARYRIIRVQETDERVTRALGRAWSRLQAEDPRIPAVIFDLTPGKSSSCGSVGWEDGHPALLVNLKPGGIKLTGADLMAWLLHQAGHAITGRPTSMEGRFHSKAYKAAVNALGLDADEGPTGHSDTRLSRGTATRYRPEIAALDRAMAAWEPGKARGLPRGPQRMACSCDPPRILRTSLANAEGPGIRCEACGQLYVTS